MAPGSDSRVSMWASSYLHLYPSTNRQDSIGRCSMPISAWCQRPLFVGKTWVGHRNSTKASPEAPLRGSTHGLLSGNHTVGAAPFGSKTAERSRTRGITSSTYGEEIPPQ